MKKFSFYKMFVEIAASKELTHSEKLIAAYLFTLFLNDRNFFGTNAYLSEKLDVQKSAISVCLQKLVRMGWITITNPKSNKRTIAMLNNPCTSKLFYRLYYIIAESKALTSLEKILISYILSFTDKGNRFYAKNAMVESTLDISKEGFNTSRIKFEEFQWIKVKYPKSPRRELIVINHPTTNMLGLKQVTNIHDEVTKLMELSRLENNEGLPNNTHGLPVNNDNYISNQINNKRNIIIEVNNEIDSNHISFSSITNSNSFLSSMVEETSPTKDASSEATASTNIINSGIKQSSTINEANASTKDDKETLSTKEPVSLASINNKDERATDRKLVREDKPFNVREYLDVKQFIKLKSFIIEVGYDTEKRLWTDEEINITINALDIDAVDDIVSS